MGGCEARALALVEPKCEIPPLLQFCPNQYRNLRGRLARQYAQLSKQHRSFIYNSRIKHNCYLCFVFTYKQLLVLLDSSHTQVPVLEQCLVGSLTGAVASQSVTEAFKGWLGTDGNRIDSANA